MKLYNNIVIVMIMISLASAFVTAETDNTDGTFESDFSADFHKIYTSIVMTNQSFNYFLKNVTKIGGGSTPTRLFLYNCNTTQEINFTISGTFIDTNSTLLNGKSVYLLGYGSVGGASWNSRYDAYAYPQARTNLIFEDADCNTTSITGAAMHNTVSVGTESTTAGLMSGINFIAPTPANNSIVYENFPVNINVSVVGFNWTKAFLNFSNTVTEKNMTVLVSSNDSGVVLDGTPNEWDMFITTTQNDSTANLTGIHTGGGDFNVSINGQFLGTILAGGTWRFDGLQNYVNKGANNVSFKRIAGTVTLMSVSLDITQNDYEFNFTKSLVPGYYNYSFVLFDGGQRYDTGRRFLTVVGNQSPAWSNVFSTPSSPTTYSPTATFNFNTTWTDYDLQTVRIFHNFFGSLKNFSLTNLSNSFNYFLGTPLAVGNYSWNQLANDSQGNTNQTNNQSFIVLRAPSNASLFIAGNTNNVQSSPPGSTVEVNVSRNIGTGNMSLLIDGVTNQTTMGNLITINYTFTTNKTYDFAAVIAESQNYSAFFLNHSVVVPPPPVFNETGFLTGSCPNDSVPNVLMYAFLIALLITFIFMAEKINTTEPFKGGVMVIVGMGIIAHAVTTLYCSSIVGIVEMVFALMLMVFGAARIWRG